MRSTGVDPSQEVHRRRRQIWAVRDSLDSRLGLRNGRRPPANSHEHCRATMLVSKFDGNLERSLSAGQVQRRLNGKPARCSTNPLIRSACISISQHRRPSAFTASNSRGDYNLSLNSPKRFEFDWRSTAL